ncbi:MAG: M13 family metallopeptidase [Pseudonocardiaceae bacterium]
MNRSRLLVVMLVTLMWAVGACQSAPQSPSPPLPLGSGLLLDGYDRGVRAQDDLFQFANGEWLRNTEMPADRSGYGAFDILAEKSEMDLRAIIDDSVARQGPPGSADQQIGDYYTSFMDTARIEQLGATPLAAPLARVDALTGPADVVRYFGESAAIFSSPIALTVGQDAKNASAYLPVVEQSGLTLPDRDYYLSADPEFTTIREKFRAYTVRILELAGVPEPDVAAGRILAMENRLAQAQWTNAQRRDVMATYNKYTVTGALAETPGLDWAAYFAAAGMQTPPHLLISEPSFFTTLGTAVTEVPLDEWKAYLKFRIINDFAPLLSDQFVTAHFDFHGRALGGQQDIRPRWKRAVRATGGAMGDLLGERYVARHFPPDAEQRTDELVSKLIDAFRTSIDGLDWMSEETKAEARDKLSKLAVKVGYPNKWRDYSALVVEPDDLVGNALRSARLEYQRQLDKLGKPVDRDEWFLTPQTVNAYYNPLLNEIVFPAAILQPPFFDAHADDAVNYGAIGAVIGHEISHAFDDQGRKFDGTGNLRDWWTEEDAERFTQRTAALTTQYAVYEPLPGQFVNGELTLGENIADLSGVTVALRSYRLSLGDRPAPVLDGFTGEQRFFLGWAQVWRAKVRDEKLRSRLLDDPHSPVEFRTNGVVSNLPEYYAAFDVKETDKLFRPIDQRVRIW